MRISNKGIYALRAMFDLAQQVGKGPVQSDDIATRQGIPVNYLNQLLIPLRQAGLIESVRGAQGGHLLALTPERITLCDIIVAIEGPLLIGEPSREDWTPTVPEDDALVNDLWSHLRGKISLMLGGITLDDLLQRKRQQAGNVMYYI